MSCVFNKLLQLIFILIFIFSCGQYETDIIPEYEPQGNVVAFLRPDSGVQLQVAITGPKLLTVMDSTRVKSVLYENGFAVDTFNFNSQYHIRWLQTYKIETLIDDEFHIVSEPYRIGDSLRIRFIEREVRSNRKDRFFFSVTAPQNTFEDTVFYQLRGNTKLLPSGEVDTIFITSNNEKPTLNLLQFGKPYMQVIREQQIKGIDNDIRPQFLSYSNMTQGVGIITLMYQHRVKP